MQRSTERILDEYLVSAALTGDAEAWRRLVVRWQPRLLSHAWRLLGEADRAKDMVQEAWVEIYRGLARLNDPAAFPAWALQIVTRRCQRLFRGNARDRRLAEELEPYVNPVCAASDEHELAVDIAQMQRALLALPAPQRAALALFYQESLSVAEIAVALDVPPGTVKTRLMHARRKVRAFLEGDSNEQVR